MTVFKAADLSVIANVTTGPRPVWSVQRRDQFLGDAPYLGQSAAVLIELALAERRDAEPSSALGPRAVHPGLPGQPSAVKARPNAFCRVAFAPLRGCAQP